MKCLSVFFHVGGAAVSVWSLSSPAVYSVEGNTDLLLVFYLTVIFFFKLVCFILDILWRNYSNISSLMTLESTYFI